MKANTIFSSFALLLMASCANSEVTNPEKPSVIEAATWKSKYYKPSHPAFTRATPVNQYRKNGTVKFLAFHHAEASAASTKEVDEIKKLGDSVWVNHATLSGEGQCFQDVAYHYVIGQSGRIFKGRPDNIAPASGTYYLDESELSGASYNDDGSVDYTNLSSGMAPGNNQGYLTICFLVKEEELTEAAKRPS